MMKLYPWHQALFSRLMASRQRMPHALLLQGRAGIGKLDFATLLAQSLLCEQSAPGQLACGSCQSCGWFAQANHPDFRLLQPEEGDSGAEEEGAASKTAKKTQIAVDQVRELAEFLGLSSHRSGLHIVLLHPAEALNQASANALLKMLEEPPPSVLFLLVSHQPQRLLPTIRSRCSKLDMPLPPRQEAEAWLTAQGVGNAAMRLASTGGAPLLALQLDDEAARRQAELQRLLGQGGRMDPFAAGALCVRAGVAEAVDMLQKWVYDLFSQQLTGRNRYQAEPSNSLLQLAASTDTARLLDFQRKLDEARRLAQHPLNAELQLEGLMLQYTQLFPAKT